MFLNAIMIVMCVMNVDASGKEGDKCTKDDISGICKDLIKCPVAIQDIKNRKMPQICSFNNKDPVVCCVENISSTALPGHTTTIRTTTEYAPSNTDNVYKEKDGCDPIPPSRTARKNGRKAWDNCIDYQQLAYPCEKSTAAGGRAVRVNKCNHESTELIVGSSVVRRNEFPHAALLAFGNDSEKLQWLCGGALISDRFILTAAHCGYSREYGPVQYAALQVTNRSDINTQHQYKVKKVIQHPEYKAPNKYHDIALLELENPILLDSFTVPACLDTGDSERENALSTSTKNDATVLQKIRVSKMPTAECLEHYPGTRRVPPFNETSQLCYGDPTLSLDICQDDGGSPLIVENQKISCIYTIIGVTSYGKGCFSIAPEVYARVEPYIPWIEGIVWP